MPHRKGQGRDTTIRQLGQTNTASNKYLFSRYEEYLEKLGNLEEIRFRSIRIICGRRSVFCISLEGRLKAIK